MFRCDIVVAAKVLDVNSKLPGCAGHASGAVSAYTQVKMKDAPELLDLSGQDCWNIWIRKPRARKPQQWDSIDDPVVPPEHGHPLAGLLRERKFEKVLIQEGWEKVSKRECPYPHHNLQLFLSVYVDDIKVAGKTQNMPEMWKKQKTSQLGATAWKVTLKSVLKAIATWRTRRWTNVANFPLTPCLDDHQIKPANLEIVGDSDCIEGLVLGKIWKTSYFGQQIGWPDRSLSGIEHAMFNLRVSSVTLSRN